MGFAISEILKGSARLIRERKKIKFYWPYLLAVPFTFEVLVFWSLWVYTMINTGQPEVWTAPRLLMLTILVVPLAFVSYLLFPSQIKEGFQLKEFYFENGKFLIGIVIFLNVCTSIEVIRTSGGQGLVGLVITLALNVLVLVNFRRLHLAWLILNFLVVNYFIFFENPIAISS
jgi:hypothetical protein